MNNISRFIALTAILIGTLAGTLFVYMNGFSGPMLLDDHINLESTRLQSLDWYSILAVFTHNFSGVLGRGVPSLSFGLTHYFHGEGTFYYKYHNFMIHCLNSLALFYLGYRLLLLTRYSKKALLIAALSAFIWLIHPLHVSTVLYIVQRMAQLSALFTVYALVCYVVGRVRIEEGRRFGLAIIFIGYPLFLILGLLSKENAALCTLYTLIIESFFFVSARRWSGGISATAGLIDIGDRRNRHRWLIRVCFIVIPLVLGVAGLLYKLDSLLIGYEARPFNLYERVLTQIHVLFYYLQLILLPRLSEYSLYHDDFQVVREFGLETFFRLSAITCVLYLAVISVFRREKNLILFGLSWFLISHAMESTILPLELIFEHRNYLALYGVAFSVSVFFIVYLPKLVKIKWFSYSITGLFCLLCLFVLSMRVDTWESDEQLTLVNVIDHPKSARAHNARANVLVRYGQVDRVLEHLKLTYQLEPWNPGGAIHLLSVACVFQKLTPDIKSQAFSAVDGAYLTAYTWLAIDSLINNINSNRCEMDRVDVFLLLDSLDKGIHADSTENQAKKSFFTARYYQFLGENKQAMDAYNNAIESDSTYTAYAVYKVLFLIDIGLLEEAKTEILSLVEKDKESLRDETLIIRTLLTKLMSAKLDEIDEGI